MPQRRRMLLVTDSLTMLKKMRFQFPIERALLYGGLPKTVRTRRSLIYVRRFSASK